MALASAPHPSPDDITAALRALAARWADAKARERGNFQRYMGELCSALRVEGPRPAGSGYEYELPVKIIDRNGKESSNFIDLFKRDHFILEAKDKEAGRSDDLMLRKAYGQARNYVTHLPGTTPPYVMVLDVGKTLVVWDRWEGGFGGFGAGKRIDLPTLHERAQDIALLQDIWAQPQVRNPRARAQAVTEKVAGKLARLAEDAIGDPRPADGAARLAGGGGAPRILRWLWPEYQVPRFGKQTETPGAGAGAAEKGEESKVVATTPWPGDAIGQLTALCPLVVSGPVTAEEAVGRFSGAKKEIVQRHLETLAILGELHAMGDGHYAAPVVVG